MFFNKTSWPCDKDLAFFLAKQKASSNAPLGELQSIGFFTVKSPSSISKSLSGLLLSITLPCDITEALIFTSSQSGSSLVVIVISAFAPLSIAS